MIRSFIYLSLSFLLALNAAMAQEKGPSPVPVAPKPTIDPGSSSPTTPSVQPTQPPSPALTPSPTGAPVPSIEPEPTAPAASGADLTALSKQTVELESAFTELMNGSPELTLATMQAMERSQGIEAQVLYYGFTQPWLAAKGINQQVTMQMLYQNGILRSGIEFRLQGLVNLASALSKNDPANIDKRLQEDWFRYDYKFRNIYSFSQHFAIQAKQITDRARLDATTRENFHKRIDRLRVASRELFALSAACSAQFGDVRKKADGSAYISWYFVHAQHAAGPDTTSLPLGIYRVDRNGKIEYVSAPGLVVPSANGETPVPQAERQKAIQGLMQTLTPSAQQRRSVDPSVNPQPQGQAQGPSL